MFPARFFSGRFFAARFFPKVGASASTISITGRLVFRRVIDNARFGFSGTRSITVNPNATIYAATKPQSVFTSVVPNDLLSYIGVVNAAHGGDVNRAVNPEDPTAFYTPSTTAFQALADIAVNVPGKRIWWESEATDGTHTNRYALDLWTTAPATAQSRIAFHANVLDIWRARQPTLVIALEFGLPAVTAANLSDVLGSLASDYAALVAYESSHLASKVDELLVIGYLPSDQSLTQWAAQVDFYATTIAGQTYATKPVQLLLNHTYDAGGTDYVGDQAVRYMLDKAAELGWASQWWAAYGSFSNNLWNVIRQRLNLPLL